MYEKGAADNRLLSRVSESDTVGWGPNGISRGWATLNKIGFKTVDAVLSNPLDRYEAYFFSGKHYALIHFQPGGLTIFSQLITVLKDPSCREK